MGDPYQRARRADSSLGGKRRSQPTVTRRGPATGRYTSPSRRQAAGHRPIRPAAPLPWSGRLAAGVVALTLVASVVLTASGALTSVLAGVSNVFGGVTSGVLGASPTPRPRPAAGPVGAPRLAAPAKPYVRTRSLDVRGTLPAGVAGKRGYRIRVFVNGKLAGEQRVPATAAFVVARVRIAGGRASEIRAAVRGPRGDGRLSAPIRVVHDPVAPEIKVTEPADGGVVNAATAVVRGVTEPRSTVTVRNATTAAAPATAVADARTGSFQVPVPLGKGSNGVTVSVVDLAGNTSESKLRIVKGEGTTTATLSISRSHVTLSRLPTSVSLSVRVLDPDRRPVPGARVFFTISPPGLPTSTFDTVTVNGEAVWRNVAIPRDGAAKGNGFATVRVVLPDGTTVQDTAVFGIL